MNFQHLAKLHPLKSHEYWRPNILHTSCFIALISIPPSILMWIPVAPVCLRCRGSHQKTGRGWAEKITLLLIGFKPEFPGLNWQSLGVCTGKVDESIGSNEILFTQLVRKIPEQSRGSSLKSPSWTPEAKSQNQTTPPHTPSLTHPALVSRGSEI